LSNPPFTLRPYEPADETAAIDLWQRTWQQARINLVQAEANRYADTAALFQALGGGWWHRSDVAPQVAANAKQS